VLTAIATATLCFALCLCSVLLLLCATSARLTLQHDPTKCVPPCCPTQATPTDFVITGSADGHLKFWKKQEQGIEFVKHYRSHIGAVDGEEE
jgi:peptidylprolyl isomerase domain and WD repeat-containing protein 1